MDELLSSCPKNQIIGDNLIRAWSIINKDKYKKILCSISGGSDSDIMLDIVWKCDKDNKVDYVWYDTGLEYEATKEHLRYLESRYKIVIKPYKAIKPIPISCKEYGQPFLSKFVSDHIYRLQRHQFKFEDKPFEQLVAEYPTIKSTIMWWCNKYPDKTPYNIKRNKWLKEFLMAYPPTFNISDKCCEYAKKKIVHSLIKENGYDINIMGVRKAEGGVRSTSYKSCYDDNENDVDYYRPLFWYTNSDKEEYECYYGVVHSRCYTEYGLKRTGCACCPFGKRFEDELTIARTYEPKLYKAVNNIFKDSYEYTRKYREFYRLKNEELKNCK